MALDIIDIPEEALFGKKLWQLSVDSGVGGSPTKIATALYENDECYQYVKPRSRDKKHYENRKKDIDAIMKRVQDHLGLTHNLYNDESKCKFAYDVPGDYMMAYSILFNCSMDYLYGLVEEKYPNAEIADIANKTGLSSKAIENLIESDEVYIDKFLNTVYHYGLDPFCDAYDEADECISIASKTTFWNTILESSLFDKIPEEWYRMACSLYTNKFIKLVVEEAKRSSAELPDWELFKSWIQTWESFHSDQLISPLPGLTIHESYMSDPEWAKQVYREIRYEHLYSVEDKEEDVENIYWGCAGKFDRYTLDMFHQMADKWCHEGPLFKLPEDE